MKQETWEKIVDKIFDFPPLRKFDEITAPYSNYREGWSSEYSGSHYIEIKFKLGRRWHLAITRTDLTHKEIQENKQ